MKRIIFIIALFSTLLASAQGLRQSVCVVYPEYTDAEKDLFSDYSLYLSRAGFHSESRTLIAYKSDGLFGSGVVIRRDGLKYVLTNTHVVGYAATVKVEFLLPKKTVRFEHCPVVGCAQRTDLALIQLPEECNQIALPLDTTEITDGMDIVAAGFPGLGVKPSWQMSKGAISNAELYDEQLLGENTPAIQHTAPIDGGSSGGPLLLKHDNQYAIIGINTWKAAYREGVGVAIPISEIQTFLQADKVLKYNDLQELKENGQAWLNAYTALPDSLKKTVQEMNTSLPLDIVKQTFAYDKELSATDKNWVKKSLRKDTKKRGIDDDLRDRLELAVGYTNYMFSSGQAINARFYYPFGNYCVMGGGLNLYLMPTLNYGDELQQAVGFGFAVNIGGQVPIVVAQHQRLIPRVLAEMAVGPIKDEFLITPALRVGADYRYELKNSSLSVGVYYVYSYFHSGVRLAPEVYATNPSYKNYLSHGIAASLSVAF